MPEKYVFALSLVVRLRQRKDEARHEDTAAALPLKDSLTCVKTVERYIKHLHRATQGPVAHSTSPQRDTELVLDDFLQAM